MIVAAEPISSRRTGGSDVQGDHAAARRRAVAFVAVPGLVVTLVILGILVVPAGLLIGAVVGVVLGVVSSAAIWRRSPVTLLGALGAQPADEERWPRPFGLIDGLCATMGLTAPTVWVVDDGCADAMVVGTSPRSVALVVTTGLLDRLDPVQLEGVLAHELSHVKHGDVALGTVAAVLVLPLAGFGDVGRLVHRWRGRGVELRTDLSAVGVTRYPPGLQSALQEMLLPASSSLASTAAGRATRWLWTVALGPGVHGEDLIGELDAGEVRVAALDEM